MLASRNRAEVGQIIVNIIFDIPKFECFTIHDTLTRGVDASTVKTLRRELLQHLPKILKLKIIRRNHHTFHIL